LQLSVFVFSGNMNGVQWSFLLCAKNSDGNPSSYEYFKLADVYG